MRFGFVFWLLLACSPTAEQSPIARGSAVPRLAPSSASSANRPTSAQSVAIAQRKNKTCRETAKKGGNFLASPKRKRNFYLISVHFLLVFASETHFAKKVINNLLFAFIVLVFCVLCCFFLSFSAFFPFLSRSAFNRFIRRFGGIWEGLLRVFFCVFWFWFFSFLFRFFGSWFLVFFRFRLGCLGGLVFGSFGVVFWVVFRLMLRLRSAQVLAFLFACSLGFYFFRVPPLAEFFCPSLF